MAGLRGAVLECRMPRMKGQMRKSPWARSFERSLLAMSRKAVKSGTRTLRQTLRPVVAKRAPPPGAGAWLPGVAMGVTGARCFRLYRPSGMKFGERLPLLVMLHGCGQDANAFAASTRMNRIAQRERFLVLYPEQDRLANAQACWNWFDTASGRAFGEAALIMKAIDQVCLLHPVSGRGVVIGNDANGARLSHPCRCSRRWRAAQCRGPARRRRGARGASVRPHYGSDQRNLFDRAAPKL